VSLGTAVLELVTDGSKFDGGLKKAKGDIGLFGKAAAIGFGAAVAGAAALGATLLNIGSDFDSALDSIAIRTGATGALLEGLGQDMQAVFTTVPTTMAAASEAIGILHQRTGLVGPELQKLAAQYLTLGRITGEEVNPIIESSQRLFQAWGIDTANQANTMDKLFVASQKSGIGVGELTASVEKFGPTLRAMGFDLDNSIALISQMEKAGVPTEVVVSGLGIAAKNFAKENIPLQAGLDKVVAKIQEMGPSSEATALAVATFGRNGVTLAEAIHRNAFTIDNELLGSLQAADDNIMQTAEGTDDWSQKVQILGNKLTTALKPAGDAVFNGLGALVTWLTPYIITLAEWIGDNLPAAMKFAGDILNELKPLFQLLGDILGWIGTNILPAVGEGFQVVGGTIRNVISAVQTLVGWLKDAWQWANNAVAAARNMPVVGGVLQAVGFAKGTDHITNGPEVFVAGEAGRERVTVQPLRGGGGAPPAGGAHGHDIVLDGRVVGGLLGRRTVRGAAFAGGSIG
jgi:phage-related minor tail protein